MKVIFTIIFCLSALIIPISAQAQDQSDPIAHGIGDPRKFDEYGNITFSDEKARLDNLVFQLKREPTYVAYLWVYAGRKSCIGEAQSRAIGARNYLVNQRVSKPTVLSGKMLGIVRN